MIYKACGNRRAAVCPSCAETSTEPTPTSSSSPACAAARASPMRVAGHPAVFATLTAPSFGPVHSRLVDAASGKVRACRPDRRRPVCPHGRLLSCGRSTPRRPSARSAALPGLLRLRRARRLERLGARAVAAHHRAAQPGRRPASARWRRRPPGCRSARSRSSNGAVSCTTTPSSASTASTSDDRDAIIAAAGVGDGVRPGARAAGGVRRDPVRHSPASRAAGRLAHRAGATRTRAASTCGRCGSPATG